MAVIVQGHHEILIDGQVPGLARDRGGGGVERAWSRGLGLLVFRRLSPGFVDEL